MTSADLIAELQRARPVADDDLRERVRAIASRADGQRRSRFAGLSLRRFTAIMVPATAVVAVGLAGVVGLTRSSAPSPVAAPAAGELRTEGATADQALTAPSAKAGAEARSGAFQSAPAPATDRAQRYSAQLAIEVKDTEALSSATQRALATTRELGGHVVSVSYASSESGAATMTLRVPTAQVQEAIVQLSSLGRIVSQQVQIDDLQGQVDELAKRETALRSQVARLSAQLAQPDLDAGTRATLQARRDAARAELSRIRAAQAQVDAEASFATIQLGLTTPESSLVPAVPSRFDRALGEAGEILTWEATALLYAAVVVLPPALLAALAWLGLGAARRRSDERLLSAS